MTKKAPCHPLPAAENNVSLSGHAWAPVLLAWYDAHRRDLPWRTPAPRDPYQVWVSEIMLQQTKVEAVRPYYLRWMERFPDIATLAGANPDDVLRHWQGLGYYSRARNLQTAARDILRRYGGIMPSTRAEIRTLKGIGDYTAGAILSLAFGLREPAIDGNVLRVFARLYLIEENILSTPVRRHVTGLVQSQLPADRPGDFNEALMDLGATLCVPRAPRCGDCPLAGLCLAHRAGREQKLPLRVVRKHVPVEHVAALWLKDGEDRLLVHRRSDSGLLAGSISQRPNLMPILDILEENGDEIIENCDSIVAEIDMDKEIIKKLVQLCEKYDKKLYGVVSNMNIAVSRRDLLQKFDCLICNQLEAGVLFSDDYSEKTPAEMEKILAERLKAANVPAMVVTMGGDGAVYAEADGESGFCPAQKVQVKDTTGAGDAFCAGVSAGLTYGKTIGKAVEIGTRLAASVITSSENVCPRFRPEEFGIEA